MSVKVYQEINTDQIDNQLQYCSKTSFKQLCAKNDYQKSNVCQICSLEDRSLISGLRNCKFCGKMVCKSHLEKERRNPINQKQKVKICSECESEYINNRIASDYQKQISLYEQQYQYYLEMEKSLIRDIDEHQKIVDNKKYELQNLIDQNQIVEVQHSNKLRQSKLVEEQLENQIKYKEKELNQIQNEINQIQNYNRFELKRQKQSQELNQLIQKQKIDLNQFQVDCNQKKQQVIQVMVNNSSAQKLKLSCELNEYFSKQTLPFRLSEEKSQAGYEDRLIDIKQKDFKNSIDLNSIAINSIDISEKIGKLTKKLKKQKADKEGCHPCQMCAIFQMNLVY